MLEYGKKKTQNFIFLIIFFNIFRDVNQVIGRNKGLEEPLHEIKNAIELAPVDVKFNA